jgi:hypothetical protein
MMMRPMRRMERRRAVAVVRTAVVGHHAAAKREAARTAASGAPGDNCPRPLRNPRRAFARGWVGYCRLEELSQLHNSGVLSDRVRREAEGFGGRVTS